MENLDKRKYKFIITYLIILVIAALFVIAAFACTSSYIEGEMTGNVRNRIYPTTRVQIDERTQECYFDDVEFTETENVIAFYSEHQYVTVIQDGRKIYEIKEVKSIFGDTPAFRWNFVEIAPHTKEVTVRIESVYPNITPRKIVFYQGNAVNLQLQMTRNGIFGSVISVVVIVIGIFLLLYWLTMRKRLGTGESILYFGIFASLVGLWMFMRTEMSVILFVKRTACSFFGYLLVMLWVIPYLKYIQDFFGRQETLIADILNGLALINLVGGTFLHMAGIIEFRQMSMGMHLMYVAVFFYLLYTIKLYRRENSFDEKVILNLCGGMVLIFVYFIDVVWYDSGEHKFNIVGHIAVLFYMMMIAWYAIKDTLIRLDEVKRMEAYRVLATQDNLTGVYNRNAYDNWMKGNKRPVGAALITFDLNNLKKCNDNLGHSVGDKYIKDSASLIQEVFGGYGTCYRIGGDEFNVVIEHVESESWIDKKLLELENLETEYLKSSPGVPMQIAYGYALFHETRDASFFDTRNRADAGMYQKKKQQKEEMQEG